MPCPFVLGAIGFMAVLQVLPVTSIIKSHVHIDPVCGGEGNLPGISYQDMAIPITAKKSFPSKIPVPLPLSSCLPYTPVSHLIPLAICLIKPQLERVAYPSSKCLHRFNASCAFVLQTVHSSLNTTFFVVFAFLWNTGFV